MINRILDLMKKNNINAKTLITETGLSNGAITDWKKGRAKPSTDAVAKIADYFNVSTDYIILGKDNLNSLSSREVELLKIFRKLESEKNQERFIGKAEMLVDIMILPEKKSKTSS